MSIRVLVVDDHAIVRDGLRALLASLGMTVVATAADGAAAISAVTEHGPQVVLMDIQMPGMDGLEATRRLTESHPDVAVVMLTMSDDDPTLAAAVAAGASGYVLKGAGQQELQATIAAAAAGQSVFSPGLAARLLAGTAPPQAELAGLTPRERDIVDLLATGRSTASIADQLYLSPKTVSNHLTTIFEKLGVANRAEAIVLAQRSGWGRR